MPADKSPSLAPALAIRRPVPRLGLTRAELALAIGFCPNTIDEMVREEALPRPRMWKKRKTWLLAEVEAYMSRWPTDRPDEGDEADGGDGGDYFEGAAA